MSRAFDPALNALPEKRERSIIPHKKIEERCNIIKKLINKLEFFKSDILFDYKIHEMNTRGKPGLQVIFFLNGINDNYCTVSYTSNTNTQLDHAHVIFVNSSLGYYTGVFLLNMQLILCYLSNISEVTLENYTDEPARAAQGIYKRFEVNKRGKSPNDFTGKNLKTQLLRSEGNMYLVMNANLLKSVKADLTKISEKTTAQPNTNPWNSDYSKRLIIFFNMCDKTFSGFHTSGGSRRRITIRHMKRRQTKNNRKSRRKVRK